MRILEGLVLRPLGSEYIVTGDELSRIDFSKVISMNETAAYLWNALQDRDFDAEDMVPLLTERYDVSEETARADARRLIASWKKAGIVCE
ncbi:MAG: PqqD family protein [Bacteroidales bacterium]|nr:PqqD family protein [Bacteroidales bacterium]